MLYRVSLTGKHNQFSVPQLGYQQLFVWVVLSRRSEISCEVWLQGASSHKSEQRFDRKPGELAPLITTSAFVGTDPHHLLYTAVTVQRPEVTNCHFNGRRWPPSALGKSYCTLIASRFAQIGLSITSLAQAIKTKCRRLNY